MTTADREQQWIEAFPNQQHLAWAAEFPGNLETATDLAQHITDPVTARCWYDTRLHPEAIAYLHARGHSPNRTRIHGLIQTAEAALPYDPKWARNTCRHAALAYAHPHLPLRDITLLTLAGLTLTEADQHVTDTGLTNRAALTLLAGLH